MINSQAHCFPFLVDSRENDAYSNVYRIAVVKHERATADQIQKIKPKVGP